MDLPQMLDTFARMPAPEQQAWWRMAAGLPISLLPVPEYQAQSQRVQSIFQAADPATAHQTARQLRIDFLWIDLFERQAYPAGVAMLESSPDYFERAFSNREVTVLRVR